MSEGSETSAEHQARNRRPTDGRLIRKYVLLMISVMTGVLLLHGLINIWISFDEQKRSLVRLQHQQAEAAAGKIAQFIREIETQLGWIVQFPWSNTTDEERRIDGLRLMSRVPAIHEIALVNPAGIEQLHLSRLGEDKLHSGLDWSATPELAAARMGSTFRGPVYFQHNSEPYIRLSVAGARRNGGVVIADINLKLMWDVVASIQIGERGKAYVVDSKGRVIAHPDTNLVLRNTDVSSLRQVQTAWSNALGPGADAAGSVATDLQGQSVLAAHARIAPLDWLVLVELPVSEAYAPVYASLSVTLLVLIAGLALAALASFVLARRMVMPIRQLQSGAALIGSGALDHRIAISSGDELEDLGTQFNEMAARLESSYATLEHKVEERTRQLALANDAKSRFLAAASHDLRQPLNALNLFVAQLRATRHAGGAPTQRLEDQARLVERIDAALSNMNELFDALLDISKLDAGVITPDISAFPIHEVFNRIETTFAAAARAKGLRLGLVPSACWVRSDALLLDRIVSNLVSNAIRYTTTGSVLVGCRLRQGALRIDVCDNGIGIPETQQRNIFAEFYRVSEPGMLGTSGLGLGLSIVDRLARLLEHPVNVWSREGLGSRFSITVPIAAPGAVDTPCRVAEAPMADLGRARYAFVIDDDPLALDAMCGILDGWGFEVVEAGSWTQALSLAADCTAPPDLIISDYHLGEGRNGIALIAELRKAFRTTVPAMLVSGETSAELLAAAKSSDNHLLSKPILPMTLRALVSKLLERSGQEPADRVEPRGHPAVN